MYGVPITVLLYNAWSVALRSYNVLDKGLTWICMAHRRYCEVYSYSFRLFFDAWSESSRNSLTYSFWKEQKFHRNESSRERKFGIGTFVLKQRKFHGSKCSREQSSWNVRSRKTKVPQERKFQGANVPRNESSTGTKVPSVDFSLPQMNEKSDIRFCWYSLRLPT